MADQTFNYSGLTRYASPEAQPLGISDETPIHVTCVYDPTQVPATGPYVWETNEGQNGSVQISVGDWTMPANADSSGTPGWPLIQFNDGLFAGVNYLGLYEDNSVQYQFLIEETDWSITIPGAEPPVVASGGLDTSLNVNPG
jgi:hypothetical protein